MRILFATDNFYPNTNGAANFSYRLIGGLIAKGHSISVIAPSASFKNSVVKYKGLVIYGIRSIMIPKKIYPAGLRVPLPFIIRSGEIKELITNIKPDVVHILDHFMIGRKIAKVSKKLGIPLVGTNNSVPENFIHYLMPLKFTKKLFLKLGWKLLADVYKKPDIVTSPSEAACILLKKLGLKNKIMNVSCGVDLNRFNPKNEGGYLKKRYKILSGKPIILFVGRLDKEKNLDTIISAFAGFLRSCDARLVIAGEGKEKISLIHLCEKLGIAGKVIFTGFISDKDLPFLYRIADLFVIASSAELQSIATMEAMASGLPVIAARILALPELVHDQKNGYLFNEGDIDTLALDILKIIKNPLLKKEMSKKSLQIIKSHNLNNTILKFENIYRSVT